jgi:hypothetical protein
MFEQPMEEGWAQIDYRDRYREQCRTAHCITCATARMVALMEEIPNYLFDVEKYKGRRI